MARSLEETLKLLYPHLKDYIQMHGKPISGSSSRITPQGFLRCPNPKHEDRNPSASIGGKAEFEGQVGHCFACSISFNIIHAAHYLENKPINGVGLFEDTLPYLCKLFDIHYEPAELSDDVKREYQKRRAYYDVTDIIHSNMFEMGELRHEHPAVKHLYERGITEESIKKYQIGCIIGYNEYLAQLKNIGWDNKEWIQSNDLGNKNLFTNTGIIIPIFDDKKRPVGFVTRKTTMRPNDHGNEKYVNSQNSDIYKKSEILFNFNHFDRLKGPLIIVEGYLDSIMLMQYGIPNVVALGSTVLTDAHVKLLYDYDIKHIFLMLDGDEAGRKGTALALERLSCYKKFTIRVIDLPENYDPDTYIQEFKVDGFNNALKYENTAMNYSPFSWTIKHSSFQDDPLVVAQKAIPIIATEEQNLQRIQMIKELSAITGISELDIRKDVDTLVNKVSEGYISEVASINNFIQVQLSKRKIDDTKSIIKDGLAKLENVERKFGSVKDTRSEFHDKLDDIEKKILEGRYQYGLKIGEFTRLEKVTDGFPFWTNMSLVGGRPSAGKSAWMTNVCIQVLDSNPDVDILYMTIDDTTEIMTHKILAMKSGLTTSKIKNIKNATDEERARFNEAWNWLRSMEHRFILPDAAQGNSIDTVEQHVDTLLKMPGDKKLLIVD